MNFKLITAAVASVAMLVLSACGTATDTTTKASTKPSGSPGSSTTPGSRAMPGSPATSLPTGAPDSGLVDGQKLATLISDAMTASKSVHTTLTGGGKSLVESDLKFGQPPSVAMKVTQGDMTTEMVQVGGVTYLKAMPHAAKPWVKLDPNGTGPFAQAMRPTGDPSDVTDPRALVSLLAGVKGLDRGRAQVDGVSTRLYSFQISLSSYGKALSPQTLKTLKGMTKTPITMSYWVGDDNLPRKITEATEVNGMKQEAGVTYRDWGKPVRIVAPPASQIGEIPGG